MKVALQISGQPRSFKSDYPSILENIIKPTNADVFITTWEQTKNTRFKDEGTVDEYITLYQPKDYQIYNYDDFLEYYEDSHIKPLFKNKREEINPYWMQSGQYQNFLCMSLRSIYDNLSGPYDVVIKGRTEVNFERPLTEEDLKLAKDCILIPNGHNSLGINDIFGLGPSKYMDVWMNLFDCIPSYNAGGLICHPELMLKHHLEENDIPVKRFEFPLYLRGERVTDLP